MVFFNPRLLNVTRQPVLTHTLTFQVASDGGFVINPKTGDSVPVTNAVAIETIIKRSGDAVRENYFPGADQFDVILEGRCYNPKIFPDNIRGLRNAIALLTWEGKPGRMEVSMPGRNSYGASAAVGEKFYGLWKPL